MNARNKTATHKFLLQNNKNEEKYKDGFFTGTQIKIDFFFFKNSTIISHISPQKQTDTSGDDAILVVLMLVHIWKIYAKQQRGKVSKNLKSKEEFKTKVRMRRCLGGEGVLVFWKREKIEGFRFHERTIPLGSTYVYM